ncbi:zinc finger protein 62 homolog isoform X1 [Leguminivora glycinivorella]|uniref:zinc finger protein 62 homolog isoform X1 n=1 Tax=Leguminivora glycinivorella TaxID=1035111 RepID=UPI00200D0092|nr:zinc finger protein 62 homolog isoform X1 [Leguminivora glycinivorella]
MSEKCNGVETHESETEASEPNNGVRQFSIADASKESVSFKDVFRGFAKSPVVTLTRADISPYLKNMRQKAVEKSELQKCLSKLEFAVHSRRLGDKCSISVLRHDLNELKMAFQKDPNDPIFNSALNIAKLKCKICEKVYSSEKKLQNHQENKHMLVYKAHEKTQKRVSFSDQVIVHEVKEYHKCRKCTKIFEEYNLLKRHMKQRHKKRKCYICNYCNKNFVDRMFFKLHIKLHCDICGDLSPNRSSYIEHRRRVCKVLKFHKCKTCEESFFKFMDLKDHSYDHLPMTFVCDICKDQFPSKCAVAHHISFLHSKARPKSLYSMRTLGSERLYLCNFCEESSVERDEVEKHVALLPDLTNRAMTGYKDYYFCDQCLKKFDVETDMLQHKWTHFLKTSDNSQLRPNVVKPKTDFQRFYKVDEVPDHMQPQVILERIKVGGKELTDSVDFVDVNCFDEYTGEIKKPVVDPVSKKTIISKHQCQICGKYYSTNYCLNRHIVSMHSDYENLKCKVCEETFVWPSLLHNHKCIRLNLPEIPFDDARPEIHFDNLNEIQLDDLPITDDDYIHTVDFEIPAPVVELREYNWGQSQNIQNCYSGCKIVMQEVPIEF